MPYELATRKEVITPLAFPKGDVREKETDADEFLQEWQRKLKKAKLSLEKSSLRMVHRAKEGRRHEEFFKGDFVLLSA